MRITILSILILSISVNLSSSTEISTSTYVGMWKYGKRDGEGTMTYSDGSKYIGMWKDDKRDGEGTMIFPDGSKYIGMWKNGKTEGISTMTFPDGTKYVKYAISTEISTSKHVGYAIERWDGPGSVHCVNRELSGTRGKMKETKNYIKKVYMSTNSSCSDESTCTYIHTENHKKCIDECSSSDQLCIESCSITNNLPYYINSDEGPIRVFINPNAKEFFDNSSPLYSNIKNFPCDSDEHVFSESEIKEMKKGFYVANYGKRYQNHAFSFDIVTPIENLCYDLTFKNDYDGNINFIDFINEEIDPKNLLNLLSYSEIEKKARIYFCSDVINFIDNNNQIMPTKKEYQYLVDRWVLKAYGELDEHRNVESGKLNNLQIIN